MVLNPMTHLVEAFRTPIYQGAIPSGERADHLDRRRHSARWSSAGSSSNATTIALPTTSKTGRPRRPGDRVCATSRSTTGCRSSGCSRSRSTPSSGCAGAWSPRSCTPCRTSTSRCRRGESVGIIGRNGAGKTTLHEGDRARAATDRGIGLGARRSWRRSSSSAPASTWS